MPHPQGTSQPPQIAIVMSNTLAVLGLSQIIGRMMPHARLVTYAAPGDLPKEKAESFFHFFMHAFLIFANQLQKFAYINADDALEKSIASCTSSISAYRQHHRTALGWIASTS